MTQDVYRQTILAALQHRPRPWSELKSLCQIHSIHDAGFPAFVTAVDGLVKEGKTERVVGEDKSSIYRLKGAKA